MPTTVLEIRETARLNRPRVTGRPSHAASTTRESAPTKPTSITSMLEQISLNSSARRNVADGARFTITTIGVVGASPRASTVHASKRAMPTGLASHTATSTSASIASARAGREASARRSTEILERPQSVDDDDLSRAAEMIDDADHLARPDLHPTRRVRDAAEHRELGRGLPLDARDETAAAVLDCVDRGAEVGLQRQAQTLRDRGPDVVAVGQDDARVTGRGDCQFDRELGPTDSGRSADRDQHPLAGDQRVGGDVTTPRLLGTERNERPNECFGRGIVVDDCIDVDRLEVRAACRLGPVEHTEHATTTCVNVADECMRQRRPPMTHDENVIRLLQRNAVLDHQAPHPSAAMITEVPMEHLHPRLGRENERDLGLAHRVAAPVARTSVTDPVSSADAIRAATSGSTASVMLASSEPRNAPPPLLENARTDASIAT